MPRKLPWLDTSAATRTKVKAPASPAKRRKEQLHDSDDDLPSDVFHSSPKRRKAHDDPLESDNGSPSAEARALSRHIINKPIDRPPSSSPVPTTPELPHSPPSPMRKALNKYDLRDDEWMMVEDEFLQTAKLFTRHLHLAEYERLRKDLRARKGKEVARPVVASAKPSAEIRLKMKARAQRKKREKLVEERAEVEDEETSEDLDAPVKTAPVKKTHASFTEAKRTISVLPSSRAVTHPISTKPATKEYKHTRSIADVFSKKRVSSPEPLKKDRTTPLDNHASSSKHFSKPSLPVKPKATPAPTPALKPTPKFPSHSSRHTSIFDLLDEPQDESPPAPPSRSSTVASATSYKLSRKPSQSSSLLDDFSNPRPKKPPTTHNTALSFLDDVPKKTPLHKDAPKRKMEKREKNSEDEGKKRKSLRVDEIPTFLV